MTTFSNPRQCALPAELMRGCSFADDFITLTRILNNNGVDGGNGNTANHGLTTTGAGYLTYDIISQPGGFSVKFQFKAATAHLGILFCSQVVAGATNDGFAIWLYADGIRATHSDGVSAPSVCDVEFDYAGTTLHTVTYVVNMTSNTHSLYVDSEPVDTQATAISTEIGTTTALTIGHNGGAFFIGNLYKARIFDAVLTEDEHDMYHAGEFPSFFNSPYSAYRCDDFGNDTDGNKIWDRTTNRRDLTLGDGATSSTFPTWEEDPTALYTFDGATDYLSGFPAMPSVYTFTAALSANAAGYPSVQADNDSTLIDDLTVAGDHTGQVHSMVLHSAVLNQLELYHDEYQHLYWLWRGRAFGAYHRLVTEGVCQLAVFFDYATDPYEDWGANDYTGSDTTITLDGTNGAEFNAADSNLEFSNATPLKMAQVTIQVYGDFAGSEVACTIVDKGANYSLQTNGDNILFNGSNIAHTFDSNWAIGVTCKPGFKPRFFVDGLYIGEGSTTETPDDTDTSDLIIGNNNAKNDKCEYPIKQVFVGNKALADREMLALGEQAVMINAA